ncbi:Golgi-specific brefeldin A-resistance guanine nucleotide exchange factor 1-like [Acanthaster planci]|uniref:Golgi-specific brefeldin A-resistance guanine nucleotide exchange factor 1-like n=1 Tax=Acanthaster planci TaxID=133434 RepID=A0A8B7Y8L8_ACAPL|nr:Golgi-specific brefeldin A-resistance guanine nucleotide exchange factor 1-like [Acanthaster planci]XP_022089652.1 Golgi-specific brefeldin A-resistance guanine nucleotide exchange factor 1-like [Acanthaster planci]
MATMVVAPKIQPPTNGVYIVQGEMLLVSTAMRRSSRWTSHLPQEEEQDPLLGSFSRLKEILNSISDIADIEPNVFLCPFLDVIRSEDTTGPITGFALSSINKFLSYGMLDTSVEGATSGIENIADAVTHARFVGTDPGSDEVVLMKILQVLRTLLLTPVGAHLSNESVCEIMQSCFRICFEMRLSELLRRSAEHTLVDMVQLLFSRLPQFKEEKLSGMRKLKMRPGGITDGSRRRKSRPSPKVRAKKDRLATTPTDEPSMQSGGAASPPTSNTNALGPTVTAPVTATSPGAASATMSAVTTVTPGTATTASSEASQSQVNLPSTLDVPSEADEQALPPSPSLDSGVDMKDSLSAVTPSESDVTPTQGQVISMQGEQQEEPTENKKGDETDQILDVERSDSLVDGTEDTESITEHSDSASMQDSEYVNPQGVRFTPHHRHKDGSGPIIPYGLPCVRELMRFLISLINPYDRHNTDLMMHMGLNLLTIALETGCDHISHFSALLSLIKDDMCKNLLALLQADRLSLFAASLRVCFMLFESMRTHLKFQLEMFLHKLMEIIISESVRIPYEQREMALDSIVQLWRLPCMVTELYLNYDCDIYCSNLFEDLTKLLSKNAFPVSGSLFTTHLLSLEALLAVVDSIETNCHHRILSSMVAAQGHASPPDRDKAGESAVTIRVQDISGKEDGDKGKERGGKDEDGARQVGMGVTPPTTGYAMAQVMSANRDKEIDASKLKASEDFIEGSPNRRVSRFPPSANLPSLEQLMQIKKKKKMIQAGTEQFNLKPSKGIAFLIEQGILHTPLDPHEVAIFFKENPRLDKKMIGEYLSRKKNEKVLEAFLKLFVFEGTRIDEALRMYLEAFRLPGEAPVIQHLMEHFSAYWHNTNHQPYANSDAAFTLAYAVIMLNVDQHNHNAKKQNIPMNVEQFKKNLSKVNGGSDFDQSMLEEVFNAIKSEEIVMPAEQTGLVRDNYLWRVLLKRGASQEGTFLHAQCGELDREMFLLAWGPTVAALSFVFDKGMDDTITQKAIAGFRKCAMISAHYGLTDVFDNLVISLCKFTTLLSSMETPENLPIAFGSNAKAHLAAKTVFGLAHRHGDILAEGWKNLLDCMLQLYRAKLLPIEMVEVQDFVDPSGRVSLIREEMQPVKSDSSLLGSFYSYFTTAETSTQKGPTNEDKEAIEQARSCIEDCHPEHLITESKFLRQESLQELMKALTFASQGPQAADSLGMQYEEEAAVFNFELLIRVVLENRDRVGTLWQGICDHLYSLIVSQSEYSQLVERAVVGILRLAIRLLRKEDIAAQVLTSLRMLLLMKKSVLQRVCRQVAYGLHELLRTNAANIHSSQDWYTLFALLECVGAGAVPPSVHMVDGKRNLEISDTGTQSDSEMSTGSISGASDQGYTSDSELFKHRQPHRSSSEPDVSTMTDDRVIVVNNDSTVRHTHNHSKGVSKPQNQFEIALDQTLSHHDTKALMKCCESLAFLVRDAAHVTPANFESCVHAIRSFVEATVNGGKLRHDRQKKPEPTKDKKNSRMSRNQRNKKGMPKISSVPEKISQMADGADDGEDDGPPGGYHSLSIQLLDLMHTLHTRAASIFSSWAEEEKKGGSQMTIDAGASALWVKCWCPLLQGIARLCCDIRRQVRMQALTYLQRALLVHDLQTLSAVEWESCFNKVLFPLLAKLLDQIHPQDPVGLEETRMRAATLLCKVFLQHLTPLLSLSTFTALWLTILDFMDKYMHADKSDLLYEAIPESLKNMLLVMDTAGVFQDAAGSERGQNCQLWVFTWERIDCFLPGLKNEVFKPHEPVVSKEPAPSMAPTPDDIVRDGSPIEEEQVTVSAKPEEASPKPSTQDATPTKDALPTVGTAATPTTTPSTIETNPVTSQPNIILQPPLPYLAPLPGAQEAKPGSSVPFLLNPAILKGSPIPIVAPILPQPESSTTGSS